MVKEFPKVCNFCLRFFRSAKDVLNKSDPDHTCREINDRLQRLVDIDNEITGTKWEPNNTDRLTYLEEMRNNYELSLDLCYIDLRDPEKVHTIKDLLLRRMDTFLHVINKYLNDNQPLIMR